MRRALALALAMCAVAGARAGTALVGARASASGEAYAVESIEDSDAWMRDAWTRDNRVMARHAHGAPTLVRMFDGLRARERVSVTYSTLQRGWTDAGVSREFDARALETAEEGGEGEGEGGDGEGEGDGSEGGDGRRERSGGDRDRGEKKIRFFTTSVAPRTLQHMLNKYGGTVESTIEAITHRLEIDPQNPFLLGDLGHTYRILGDNERAAEVFTKALRQMEHPELFQMLGTCLMVTDRVDEAIATFRRGADAFPQDLSNRFSLALVSLELDDLHEAINELEAIVRLSPNFAGGLANEHLQAAKLAVQRRSSGKLDTGMFVMFIATLAVIAWLKCARFLQRKKKKARGSKVFKSS